MTPTAEKSRVTKKKLTVAQAAEQFVASRRERERLKALEDEAAAVLKTHFEKTGRTSYKGMVALITTAPKLVLDQTKVREFLGDRLGEFQKRTAPSKSLTLLD